MFTVSFANLIGLLELFLWIGITVIRNFGVLYTYKYMFQVKWVFFLINAR